MEKITTTKEQFMSEFTRNLNSFQPTMNVLINAYVALCNKFNVPHYEMLMETAGFEKVEGTDEWILKQEEVKPNEKPAKSRKPRK